MSRELPCVPSAPSISAMWLTREQLLDRGFASVGDNVLIDDTVVIYGAPHVSFGDNVRVDSGVQLTGGPDGPLVVGDYVHISAMARVLASSAPVTVSDFCGIAPGALIFSASDDYSSGALTGPLVPPDLRNATVGAVFLGPHVVIGANSVVLPGATLEFGASVGALTVVRRSLGRGEVVYGNPMRRMRVGRDTDKLAQLSAELRARED